jgi:hypothetical protein
MQGLFPSALGVALLKSFGQGKRIPNGIYLGMGHGVLCSLAISHNDKALGGILRPVYPSEQFRGVGHLGDGTWGYKTADVQNVKPYLGKFLNIMHFLVQGEQPVPALHGVPGAFHPGYAFHPRRQS